MFCYYRFPTNFYTASTLSTSCCIDSDDVAIKTEFSTHAFWSGCVDDALFDAVPIACRCPKVL